MFFFLGFSHVSFPSICLNLSASHQRLYPISRQPLQCEAPCLVSLRSQTFFLSEEVQLQYAMIFFYTSCQHSYYNKSSHVKHPQTQEQELVHVLLSTYWAARKYVCLPRDKLLGLSAFCQFSISAVSFKKIVSWARSRSAWLLMLTSNRESHL